MQITPIIVVDYRKIKLSILLFIFIEDEKRGG